MLLSIRSLRLALALALCPLVATSARAGVLVVDASGNGDFTQIQPAIDAALSGDTLLVESGEYASFLLNAKSLTIVGDEGADVTITGGVRVRSLPAGGTVVLANLSATGSAGTLPTRYGLYLSDNQGSIRVGTSFFTGAPGTGGAQRDGADGLHCELSPDVVLTRCGLYGGQGSNGLDDTGVSGAGARLTGSTVAFYDCVVEGGHGQAGSSLLLDGGHGGAGARAEQSTFFASNTVFYGGNGGNGSNPGFRWSIGGNGGDGISLATGALARLLDVVATGGSKGLGWTGISRGGPNGRDGLAHSGAPAQFVEIAGSGRELQASAVLRADVPLAMTLTGEPGDRVGLLLSGATQHVFVALWRGVLTVPLRVPHLALWLGFVPPSGALDVTMTVPSLPVGVDARSLFVQPMFYDVQNRHRLGSPLAVTVLDPGL